MTFSTPRPAQLHLPDVTLCAITSVNVGATIEALKRCMKQAQFKSCKLFTDLVIDLPDSDIETVPIKRLESSAAYSDFVQRQLADHVTTSHCLLIQWDGFIANAESWLTTFLDYDYIGATWPQFDDGRDVGNGGFSLRSRKLLAACQSPLFRASHPEDVAIGRHNRDWLEAQGLRFASSQIADLFSSERTGDPSRSFGFHGVWHIPKILGPEGFWDIYRTLDERGTIRHDLFSLMQQLLRGPAGIRRASALIADHFSRSTSARHDLPKAKPS